MTHLVLQWTSHPTTIFSMQRSHHLALSCKGALTCSPRLLPQHRLQHLSSILWLGMSLPVSSILKCPCQFLLQHNQSLHPLKRMDCLFHQAVPLDLTCPLFVFALLTNLMTALPKSLCHTHWKRHIYCSLCGLLTWRRWDSSSERLLPFVMLSKNDLSLLSSFLCSVQFSWLVTYHCVLLCHNTLERV